MGRCAIEFVNVSLAFDDTVVLRGVSFSVQEGSTAVLLGASTDRRLHRFLTGWVPALV